MPLTGIASDSYLIYWLRRLPMTEVDAGAEPVSCPIFEVQYRQGPAPSETDVTSGPIGEAIGDSSLAFYEQLADDLREAAEIEQALSQAVKQQFKGDPPDLQGLGRALGECKEVVDLILAVKRREASVAGADSPEAMRIREAPRQTSRLPISSDVPGPRSPHSIWAAP